MSHDAETTQMHKTPGGLDSGSIFGVGVVGTLLLIVIVVAASAWYFAAERKELAQTVWREPNAALAEYKAEQDRLLNEVNWSDKENGVATMPIDMAIQKMAEEGVVSGAPR